MSKTNKFKNLKYLMLFTVIAAQATLGAMPVKNHQQLLKELREAKVANVHLLAPVQFERTLEKFESTKEDGLDPKEQEKLLVETNKMLEEAKEYAAVSEAALKDSYQAMIDAVVLGVPQKSEDFVEAKERFVELSTAIESGDLQWAKKYSPELATRFKSIELSYLKSLALDPIRKQMEIADKIDAEDLAPQTFKKLEARINTFEKELNKKAYDRAWREKTTEELVYQAKRLNAIAREVELIEEAEEENVVLWIESRIGRLSNAISQTPNQDAALDTQFAQLEKTLSELKGSSTSLASQTNLLSEQLQKVESQAQTQQKTLKSLRELTGMERALAEVSAMFDPQDAEIYRKSNSIVIRLSRLGFPSGRSTIPSQDFGLLGKVAKALEALNVSKVIVEGHTDSTGLATTNQALSRERAQAVTDYLTTNSRFGTEKFTVIGRGEEFPVASNRSKQGRQTNRRVEVIAFPGSSQPQTVSE